MIRKLFIIIILNCMIYTFVYIPCPADPVEGLTVERIWGKPSLLDPLPSNIQWAGNSKGVSYLEDRGEGEEKQTFFVVQSVPRGTRRTICIPDTVTVPVDLRKSEDTRFSMGSCSWDKKGNRVVFTFGGELFTLERKSGRIIFIASQAGLKGYAGIASYCAAKFGVIGLMKGLAIELAPHGINVNAVCPGSVDTEGNRGVAEEMGVSFEEMVS